MKQNKKEAQNQKEPMLPSGVRTDSNVSESIALHSMCETVRTVSLTPSMTSTRVSEGVWHVWVLLFLLNISVNRNKGL